MREIEVSLCWFCVIHGWYSQNRPCWDDRHLIWGTTTSNNFSFIFYRQSVFSMVIQRCCFSSQQEYNNYAHNYLGEATAVWHCFIIFCLQSRKRCRLDNIIVPMQCTGNSSCFPRGKRAAIVRCYPAVLCACVCVCVPRKRFLRNCWSDHQAWHGGCLRHDNASHVNYFDLHSRSQILIMKIIKVWLFQKPFKQWPSCLL